MADISIGNNHLAYLARMEHVGEWLQAEMARIEMERRTIMGQAQRHSAELIAFLQQSYGIDAQHVPVTVDTARGVLITPDASDVSDEPPTESK